MAHKIIHRTKIAKAITNIPGMWAPYDRDTHQKTDGKKSSGPEDDVLKSSFHHYVIEEESIDGESMYYIRHIYCKNRLRTWHLNVLLALSCMSVEHQMMAHDKFGNLGDNWGKLHLPTNVKRGEVSTVPKSTLFKDTESTTALTHRDSGCPDMFNVECILRKVSLTQIASMVYADGSTSKFDERSVKKIRDALKDLSMSSIQIYQVTSKELSNRIANGDLFKYLEESKNEEAAMTDLIAEEGWEGRVKVITDSQLIVREDTKVVTVKGVPNRVYDIRINPLIAMSIAYGRSVSKDGRDRSGESDTLSRLNHSVHDGVLPNFLKSFVQTFRLDLEVRRKIGGMNNERMLALYHLFETKKVNRFKNCLTMDDLINAIYGPDYLYDLGGESRIKSIREYAKVKLRKTKSHLRHDLQKLAKMTITDQSSGKTHPVIASEDFAHVFGNVI